MEWVDGARLNDEVAIKSMGLESKQFIDTLVQCSMRQMLGISIYIFMYMYILYLSYIIYHINMHILSFDNIY